MLIYTLEKTGVMMNRNELTFPKGSLLGRINDDTWQRLSSTWTLVHCDPGQVLINAEDDGGDVYFVLRGAAKATVYTDAGREVSFVAINIGDCFGEFSAIDLSPRSATVVAHGECLAARMSQKTYRNLVQSTPDLAFCSMVVLVGHLRRLSKRVVDFNSKSAVERLHYELLQLAVDTAGPRDEVVIERPPTQSALAATIFSSRESVAREMGRMRSAGVLARQRRSLHVPSIDRLRQYIARSAS
jgi:CRP-like cAMP-binding protein